MPQFRYEITDKAGKPLRGVMDAISETEVRSRLVGRGYAVSVVVPVSPPVSQPQPRPQSAVSQPASVGPTLRTSAPANEMMVFFRGLAQYMQSGIPIYQALVQIGTQSPNRAMRSICERMAMRVQAGQSLATAMTEFPHAFPPHVVGVVTAGELGGFLPVVIGDIALDYELAERASIKFGRVWVWLLWINALATIPLIPIPPMMYSPGVTSPQEGIMKGLVWSAKFLVIPLVLLIIAYFTSASILRQPSMRLTAHRLLLRVPWAGRASKERSLATFTRILWRLQNAGILPIHAWDAAARSAENTVISRQLYSQLDGIKMGRKFSEALTSTRLFSSEDQRVLATGEATGQVADILQRIAAHYEDAALFSGGRARWTGLRVAITANVIVMGAVTIAIFEVLPMMMKWMDQFFQT